MKSLFLTREQALQLADDLKEYTEMEDSSNRDIFRGFEIKFDDKHSTQIICGEIRLYPQVNYTLIDDGDNNNE